MQLVLDGARTSHGQAERNVGQFGAQAREGVE
jgi:hypothetical protein